MFSVSIPRSYPTIARLAGAVLVATGTSFALSTAAAAATTPQRTSSAEPAAARNVAYEHGHGFRHRASGRSNSSFHAAWSARGMNGHSSARSRHGDNGTVKVHRSSTSAENPRNEPKVCAFYLVGFGFDPAQQVSWRIKSWPPTGDRTVVSKGTLTLDAHGHGRTDDLRLASGHYKLFWNFAGEKGRAKYKVFWVDCGKRTPLSTSSPSPTGTPTVSPGPTQSPVPTGGVSPTQSPTPTESRSPVAALGGPTPPSGGPTQTPAGQAQPPSPTRAAASHGASAHGVLPFTGFPLAVAAGIGLLLLLGGAGALVASRARGGR